MVRSQALTLRDALRSVRLSVAETLGTANAGTRKLESTFTTKTSVCLSVGIVGVKSWTKTLSGEAF